MPSYDFRCKECGYRFTVKVAIKDKDQVRCESCESDKVEQLFTGFATTKSTGTDSGCGRGCGVPSGSPFS